jgi:aspartyl/asparaginyl-tRNA synthetase
MVPIFERVYEIGRAYRAEKSNTSRHMSEILMLDMEMGFIDSFEDIIEMTEKFVNYVIEKTWEEGEQILLAL